MQIDIHAAPLGDNIPPEQLMPGIPLIDSPLFSDFADRVFPDPTLRDLAERLHRDGYAIVDMPDPEMDRIAEDIKRELQPLYSWDAWREGKRKSLRIQNAWRYNENVRRLAVNPVVLDWLSQLWGRRAFPSHTINMAVGTSQVAHSDDVHFNSLPEGFMGGVWVALEDMDADNGTLFLYPGSHRWPILRAEHIGADADHLATEGERHRRFGEIWDRIAASQGIERKVFVAKKGQALIWSARTVHGGMPLKSRDRTRWSQVTHYFFDDCGYTNPIINNPYTGARYQRPTLDITTGMDIPNRMDGEKRRTPYANLPEPDADTIAKANALMAKAVDPQTVPGLPPSFDGLAYLLKNRDLLGADVDPYWHFVRSGAQEDREW